MEKKLACGCEEYRELSRRGFLGAAPALAAAAAALPGWLPRIALARDWRSGRDILVNIFLRGGCDGLNMVVPAGDTWYYKARPTLGVPAQNLKPLDAFFGLVDVLAPLLPAYQAKHLAFVHAVGSPDPTRSHFEAMRFMETATPNWGNNPPLFSGWLARHLLTAPPASPNGLRAVAAGTLTLPTSLNQAPGALAIRDLSAFGFPGNATTAPDRREALTEMYEIAASGPVGRAALDTFQTIDLLAKIDFQNYKPAGGAVYPQSPFGTAMKQIAALIKADVGVEVCEVDKGGWDTHAAQGTLQGRMQALMDDLAKALAAFYTDMLPTHLNRITVVVMSEFGRRVDENGSAGTDHGHGNMMMVLGGNVLGGRVVTKWPGLDPTKRYQGLDLQVTTDYRDVLAEIVDKRLGNKQGLGQVFPNHTPSYPGIVK